MSKIYEGKKNAAGKLEVTVNGKPLRMRSHPENVSAAAFSWGDCSPGARNLAYSLLLDAMSEDSAALVCDSLLTSVVSKLDSNRWRLNEEDLIDVSNSVCAAGSAAQQRWTSIGAPLRDVPTIPMFPKIIQDPNYHLRGEVKFY